MKSAPRKICIFIGPPGAGKGSLSALCTDRLGWQQFSTGNVCRWHIAQGTDIGKQIDFTIKSGNLISDDLIMQMVDQWLLESRDSAHVSIFDGLPRTLAQARALDPIFGKENFDVSIVHLQLDDDIIVDRLSSRVVCSNKSCQAVYSTVYQDCMPESSRCSRCHADVIRRPDDAPEAIRDRLRVYHATTQEVLKYYAAHKYPLIDIVANNEIENIFAELKQRVMVERT